MRPNIFEEEAFKVYSSIALEKLKGSKLNQILAEERIFGPEESPLEHLFEDPDSRIKIGDGAPLLSRHKSSFKKRVENPHYRDQLSKKETDVVDYLLAIYDDTIYLRNGEHEYVGKPEEDLLVTNWHKVLHTTDDKFIKAHSLVRLAHRVLDYVEQVKEGKNSDGEIYKDILKECAQGINQSLTTARGYAGQENMDTSLSGALFKSINKAQNRYYKVTGIDPTKEL